MKKFRPILSPPIHKIFSFASTIQLPLLQAMALLNIEFRDSRMKVGESVMNTQSRGEVFGVSERLRCDFLTIMEPDSY